MNIASTQYNLKNKAIEIYLSGCTLKCKGCHNYDIWDFNKGKYWTEYKEKVEEYCNNILVDNIWILGGEPLQQEKDDLKQLLLIIKKSKKDIMLWTGFNEKNIFNLLGDNIKLIDYIKIGKFNINDNERYIDRWGGINLKSSQHIYKIQQNNQLKLLY